MSQDDCLHHHCSYHQHFHQYLAPSEHLVMPVPSYQMFHDRRMGSVVVFLGDKLLNCRHFRYQQCSFRHQEQQQFPTRSAAT